MATGSGELNFGTGSDEAVLSIVTTGLNASTLLEAFGRMATSSDGSRQPDDARVDPVDYMTEFVDATHFNVYGKARLGTIAGKVPFGWASV
jgi:hypothetical protein